MVLKALLLAGYFFLFSVQICFRYTPESLDLDTYSAYAGGSQHIAQSNIPGHHFAIQPLHHQKGGSHTSILNKRFEPVVVLAIPAQEFRVTPIYTERRNSFPLFDAKIACRDALTIPLRGPPAEAC